MKKAEVKFENITKKFNETTAVDNVSCKFEAGTGGSNLPDIPAEFSDANHGRGAVSMARAQNPNPPPIVSFGKGFLR